MNTSLSTTLDKESLQTDGSHRYDTSAFICISNCNWSVTSAAFYKFRMFKVLVVLDCPLAELIDAECVGSAEPSVLLTRCTSGVLETC